MKRPWTKLGTSVLKLLKNHPLGKLGANSEQYNITIWITVVYNNGLIVYKYTRRIYSLDRNYRRYSIFFLNRSCKMEFPSERFQIEDIGVSRSSSGKVFGVIFTQF